MDKNSTYIAKTSHILKFVIFSVIGVFLFMALIPDGDGSANIPLGYAISLLGLTLNEISINGFELLIFIALIVITISFVGSLLAYTVKPAFIMENQKFKDTFLSHPVYFISKALAVIFGWLMFFGIGPSWLIGWGGARLMMDIIGGGSSGSNLMSIFIILGIAIPLLTDFGIMEFLGTLIRKVIRVLFTLPGRSSVDLLGSWFSSSAASVIITRNQHERGYYTGREAASICVNFTLVSLPFTFVVASAVELQAHFLAFYLIICAVSIVIAMIMPRIWPLRNLPDEYLPGVGKQIEEDVPADKSMFSYAVALGSERASKTTAIGVLKSGLYNWVDIFMDLIPVILAWGTIALIVEGNTPVFDILSMPFRWLLELLRVDGAQDFAATTVVGFIDMFLPAILLGEVNPDTGDFLASLETRFILAALSIVQIIYMAETGILILKSKMPLNIGHLAIIFIMRTILALPLIVLLTRVFAGL